ncbi:cellulase family glycosylhydrolase [Hymenobacter sp. BT507]|uniref:mannan endo-1,4-beta-mannosidase n=1 Tax=Hymenobacter citatus TaxID=2763506 RepID=A0ABR7MJL5_9BACT|nr:cellulase family glycosylhydrolase [Hymenobacter citatus]MBC6611261.1 cellulase family glycosylhydrolase [Hymenobacter citatus]
MQKVFIFLLFSFSLLQEPVAQAQSSAARGDVYVDKQGVLRWQKGRQEVALFGVNYTTPFAYSYRAHRRLGVSPEQAIEQDVYHLARLGVDAFRVHVWDVEITDTVGNLLENEHLRLLDFLVGRLKEHGIKIILTPIAYWGNGYPEPDTAMTGFSSIYDKGQAYTNPRAVAAQERYLTQFLNHRNTYTKQLNRQDPDIIAFEVCNEPRYHEPAAQVTAFANRMAAAIRNTGCRKPVFYNIAENPRVHEAILNAKVDGITYQWYPEGLVGGHTLHGNFLPYVDQYPIPYRQDKRFASKAKMVYEFESADILQPIMYPAMARSFRAAGFQWATQFAYDPLAIAYANTEYQTHYLNLAYTPSKALSLLIAGQVFRQVKRGQQTAAYPADSTFGAFRISYREQLSEMNTPEAFYYTSNTRTQPQKPAALRHVAGVGSSPVVRYGGTGAYFLDQLAPGVWRLEVMPDAVQVADPFAQTSLQRTVTRIEWNPQPLRISLADLGPQFTMRGLNKGNAAQAQATNGEAVVRPGVYLLAAPQRNTTAWTAQTRVGALLLGEFVAPAPTVADLQVLHEPYPQVAAGQPLRLTAKVVGLAPTDSVLLVAQHYYGRTQTLPMQRIAYPSFEATVPAELLYPGLLRYWIVVKQKGRTTTFPGSFAGSPRQWDYAHPEHWETAIVPAAAPLPLFTAATDQDQVELGRIGEGSYADYVTSPATGALAVRLIGKPQAGTDVASNTPAMCLRTYFGDKVQGRRQDMLDVKELVLTGAASQAGTTVQVVLVTKDAAAYATTITLGTNRQTMRVPLADFRPAPLLLSPRPYPSFLPLTFQPATQPPVLRLADAEVLQVVLPAAPAARHVDIESVQLR